MCLQDRYDRRQDGYSDKVHGVSVAPSNSNLLLSAPTRHVKLERFDAAFFYSHVIAVLLNAFVNQRCQTTAEYQTCDTTPTSPAEHFQLQPEGQFSKGQKTKQMRYLANRKPDF
jgi:hypothetical protein